MKTPRGSVTEHHTPDGRIRYRVRVTLAGARKSLGLYDSEAEAHAVLAEALEQVADEARGGLTLRQWGERWLDRREKSGLHRASAKDRNRWRYHVDTAPFADWPMRRIARTDVVAWARGILQTPATRAVTRKVAGEKVVEHHELGRSCGRGVAVHALNLVRSALTDAADEGLVPACVAAGVRVPRVPRGHDTWAWLTTDEIARLFALPLRDDQRAIFSVAIYCGLRAGELWGLRWCDVTLDGEHPEIIVRRSRTGPPKGGKPRPVPLLSPAVEALSAWRSIRPGIGEALVFPSEPKSGRGAGGCHSSGYSAGWPRVKKILGIARRVRMHDLRHTCASHLVMGTWTPEPWELIAVRDYMGHSSITVTERYAHLSPAGNRARAAAERKNAEQQRVSDIQRTPAPKAKTRKPLVL